MRTWDQALTDTINARGLFEASSGASTSVASTDYTAGGGIDTQTLGNGVTSYLVPTLCVETPAVTLCVQSSLQTLPGRQVYARRALAGGRQTLRVSRRLPFGPDGVYVRSQGCVLDTVINP